MKKDKDLTQNETINDKIKAIKKNATKFLIGGLCATAVITGTCILACGGIPAMTSAYVLGLSGTVAGIGTAVSIIGSQLPKKVNIDKIKEKFKAEKEQIDNEKNEVLEKRKEKEHVEEGKKLGLGNSYTPKEELEALKRKVLNQPTQFNPTLENNVNKENINFELKNIRNYFNQINIKLNSLNISQIPKEIGDYYKQTQQIINTLIAQGSNATNEQIEYVYNIIEQYENKVNNFLQTRTR